MRLRGRFRRAEDAYAVRAAMRRIPQPILHRLEPMRLVTDYDPRYLGVHYYRETGDGREYSSTSHCAYPIAQMHRPADDRPPTVFLMGEDHAKSKWVILHELGHVLDWALGFPRLDIVPLSRYATKNAREAFATAFQAWLTDEPYTCGWPPKVYDAFPTQEVLLERDPATASFFDGLAAEQVTSMRCPGKLSGFFQEGGAVDPPRVFFCPVRVPPRFSTPGVFS